MGPAVSVEPVGARPAALVTVHVRGALPAQLRIDGATAATARRTRVRIRLPRALAPGRHRLTACRPRRCGPRATVVVTRGPILAGCPVLPPGAA